MIINQDDAPNKMVTIVSLLALIFLFLLSDFYFVGIGRLFDYVAIVFLLIFFVLKSSVIRRDSLFKKSLVLSCMIAPWAFFGAIFNESILAAGAMLTGIIFIFPLSYGLTNCKFRYPIENQINLLIAISSLLLMMQVLVYYGTGIFIDMPGIFGATQSRGLNQDLNYFRPSGIFQEPNAYCAVMFCLLSACSFFRQRNSFIEFLGIFTIILTQSLWGFGAVLVLIYVLYGTRWLAIAVGSFAALMTLIVIVTGINLENIADASITFDRIININADPSRQARFGSFENVQLDFFLFTGHGIDTLNFQSIAANGFAFLLYSFGVSGSLILALYFIYLVRGDNKLLITIGFLLTTFPLFSYMFFWSWLAIIISLFRTSLSNGIDRA